MATLKNILRLSVVALLISACGAKSQLGSYYNYNSPSNYSYQDQAASYYAGSLPQLANEVQSNAVVQSPVTSQPVQSQSFPVTNSLYQTSQDFGYLNSCYRTILQQGSGYFQMGYSADSIFQQAAQALVKCYNDVIQTRTTQQQQLQAYQNYIYQQNYINSMAYATQITQQYRNQQTQFTIGRPPGAPR